MENLSCKTQRRIHLWSRPMVYDDVFVYAEAEGKLQTCHSSKDNRKIEKAVVVLATNKIITIICLLICNRILAAHTQRIIPPDVAIFVSSDSIQNHQDILDFLNIPIQVQSFGILESVRCETLYILDVTHPGHAINITSQFMGLLSDTKHQFNVCHKTFSKSTY